jgi:hypothetical protein
MNAIEVLRDHLNIELLRLMEPIQESTTVQIVAPKPSIVNGYYDLNDAINVEWIATSQSCWSTHSRSDEACKACSLSVGCKEAKSQVKEDKAESKELVSEIRALFDAKAKRAVLKLDQIPQEVELKADIQCLITSAVLKTGETHLFYPEFGIVHLLAKHINN